MVLAKGKYTYSGSGKYLKLPKPIKICGQGIGETILDGFGLYIQGSKSNGSVVIEDLTIQGGKGKGLWAYEGMDLIVRRCKVEKCQYHGVNADNAHISCEDVQVVGCVLNGVYAYQGGTVKLSGENTRIEGNVTNGNSRNYGLTAWDSFSKIQIVTPLTKDTISTNNGGGGRFDTSRRYGARSVGAQWNGSDCQTMQSREVSELWCDCDQRTHLLRRRPSGWLW